MKKTVCLALVLALVLGLFAGCGSSQSAEVKGNGEGKKITIAYQYGISYFPFQIMKEKNLIEKNYPGVTVEWQQLNSGAAICEGITAGSIDVGAMGPGPLIINILAGAPMKVCSSFCSCPMRLMSLDENASLDNIADGEQIALVNIGSIQHICLAMAAEKRYGDAHRFDEKLLAMSHPDGMSALVSGSVKYQLTNPPYYQKSEAEGAHIVDTFEDVWPVGTTFIASVASTKLHEDTELYKAVVSAIEEAIDYINNNKADVAKLLCANENTDETTLLSWLEDPATTYSSELCGVMDIANFMYEAGFVSKQAASLSDLAYDNVKGN